MSNPQALLSNPGTEAARALGAARPLTTHRCPPPPPPPVGGLLGMGSGGGSVPAQRHTPPGAKSDPGQT